MNITTINATMAKQHFGTYLTNVAGGPVIIEKSGNPTAVMISYNEFVRLSELEDMVLLKEAIEASNEGFLSNEESLTWFAKMNEKAFSIANK